MSQVVSNNVALFFSIFDKHTEKQSLIGKCIYTDGQREDFCFYFLVINVYRGKATDAFHPCGELRNG